MTVVIHGKLSGFVDVEKLVIEKGGVFEGNAFVREASVDGGKLLHGGVIAYSMPWFNACIAFVLQSLLFSFPDQSHAWLFAC